jgi:uncharacterized protein YifE (UPF0438 family)
MPKREKRGANANGKKLWMKTMMKRRKRKKKRTLSGNGHRNMEGKFEGHVMPMNGNDGQEYM